MDASAEDTYVPQSEDTEAWADRMLFEHWGAMGLEAKARLVQDLCRSAKNLALRGMAVRHPAASHEELELRLACLRLGRETVERVLGRPLAFVDMP